MVGCLLVRAIARARATLNNNNIGNKAELKRWIPMTFLLLAQLVTALSAEEMGERSEGREVDSRWLYFYKMN